MVGPKKQDFWPRINILQGRHGEFQPDKVQYSTPNFFEFFPLSKFVDSWPKNLAFQDPPSLKFHNRTDIDGHMIKIKNRLQIFFISLANPLLLKHCDC